MRQGAGCAAVGGNKFQSCAVQKPRPAWTGLKSGPPMVKLKLRRQQFQAICRTPEHIPLFLASLICEEARSYRRGRPALFDPNFPGKGLSLVSSSLHNQKQQAWQQESIISSS